MTDLEKFLEGISFLSQFGYHTYHLGEGTNYYVKIYGNFGNPGVKFVFDPEGNFKYKK